MTTPNDLAHRRLQAAATPAREAQTALAASLSEVDAAMGHFTKQGYRFDEAAQLTAIALDNVLED